MCQMCQRGRFRLARSLLTKNPPEHTVAQMGIIFSVPNGTVPFDTSVEFLIGLVSAKQTDLVLEHCKLLEQVVYGTLIVISHRLLDIE